MSNNFLKDNLSDANSLIKENQILKQQIEELKNELTLKNTVYDFESSVFQKAKSISNLAYWSFSFKDYTLLCSEEAYKIFEINSKKRVLDYKSVVDFIHPEDKENFIHSFEKMLVEERFKTFNFRIIVPDGSIKYLTIKVLVDKDENNNPQNITGTVTDNTETNFRVETLTESEKLFRNLYDNITDIFVVFETIKGNEESITDYLYKEVNPAYELKFGLKKDEILNTNLSVQPDLFNQLNPLLSLTAIAGQPQQDRLFIQSLDGFYDVLIYSIHENILAAVFRDVSLMVEADSSLRESEEKYRQIFSIVSDAILMIDFSTGKILDVNPTACKMLGYTKNELLKLTFSEISASPEKIKKEISEHKLFLLNEICIKKDQSKVPVELALSYFNWSGRKVYVASLRDISERIVAQENLVRSEEKFKQLFNFSNDAILIIKNYRIIDFNQKSVSLFKIKSEDLINKTLWNLSPGKQSDGEDSRTKAVEYIQNSFMGKQLQFDWIFQKNDSSLFTADIKLSPITYGNEKVVQVIVRDISHQKESQDALKSKEQRWKLSLEISSIGVWDWNVITNEIYFSSGWKAMLGYEPNEIPNKFEEYESRIHPDDVSNVYNLIDDYLSARIDNYLIDFRLRCKNGTYKWVRSSGKVISFNASGKPERFLGTHFDITRQKVLEEKLIAEKNEFNIASEISKMGYWIVDLRNMIISGSKHTFNIFGYEGIEQLSMRQLEVLIHPEDRKNFISQFIATQQSSSTECVFRILVSNQTRFIISKSRPIKNSDSVLMGYKGIFQDITSIKQEEIAVRTEQNLLLNFTENIQNSILIIQDDKILFSNDRMTELTGFSTKEISSEIITPFKLAVPEDRILIKKFIDSAYSNNTFSEKIDVRIETKSGRIKWVELQLSSFIFKNNLTFIYMMSDISDRKNRENEIINSEIWFRSVTAFSSYGVAIINPEGNFLYFNNSLSQITNLDTLTIKTKGFLPVIPENDLKAIRQYFSTSSVKETEPYTLELQLTNNKKWIQLSIKPIAASKSNIDFFIITVEDIEFRKTILNKVESEKNNLNNILENTPQGIGLYSKDLKLIHHNPLYLEYIGNPALSQDMIVQSIQNNNLSQREIISKDNHYYSLRIVETLISEEKHFIVFIKDITSEKILIEDAGNQIEKFRNIFEKAPMGIALIDKNRHIIFSNKQYAQLLGFEIDELLQKKLDEITYSENLGESISKLSQIFTGVIASYNQVTQMYYKNGERIWINSNVSQMKDKYGDTTCAIQIIEDISRLKNDEQKNFAKERLKTIKLISNFYSVELIKLLSHIDRNSYALLSKINDDNLYPYVTNIIKSLESAEKISGEIIPFSDKFKKIDEIVSVSKLIEEVISEFNLTSNVKITKITKSQNDKVTGDPELLKKAFFCIIENSLHSVNNIEEIFVSLNSVYFDNKDLQKNGELNKGRYLRVTISDSERVIAQSELERFFDPFNIVKSIPESSGIGLSLSRKIIYQHKGLIKIFSNQQDGTKFNIYIPQNEADSYDMSILPDEKISGKGLFKMMIIDDEKIVRDISSKIVSAMGYDAYCFSNATKALQFFKINSHSIDIVLLDGEMPKTEGKTIINKLKTINANVKVIVMSGFNIDDSALSENIKEADGFFQKPISIEKIINLL